MNADKLLLECIENPDRNKVGNLEFCLFPKPEISEAEQDQKEAIEPVKPIEELNRYGWYSFRSYDLSGQSFRLGLIDAVPDDELKDDKIFAEWFDLHSGDNRPFYLNGRFPFFDCTKDKIRLILENKTSKALYISNIIRLKRETNKEESVKMFQEINNNQPLLLLSVFHRSPLSVFLKAGKSGKDSIETRLELMERSIKVYQKQYADLRKTLKFKLKSFQYIDRIDKLSGITSDTLSFMTRNPQYLVEVKRDKGIHYNQKIYLPSKTLVSKNVIDYDTYENRYIISFLKMLKEECGKIKIQAKLLEDYIQKHKKEMGSIPESKKNDLDSVILNCQYNLERATRCENNIGKWFSIYKTMFQMENAVIRGTVIKPRATAVFKQIPEYNIFLTRAFLPWFETGIEIPDLDDSTKDLFTVSASEPATTYELYNVIMILRALENAGYAFDYKKAMFAGVREKESRYQDYAYEFVFYKDFTAYDEEQYREEITLYYSPSVFTLRYSQEDEVYQTDEKSIDNLLYRNTPYSLPRDEDDTGAKGDHYEPDYIIKYQKGLLDKEIGGIKQEHSIIRYIMADAKHKDFEDVWKKEMPRLVYKYLDSIKINKVTMTQDDMDAKIIGLAAFYNSDKTCSYLFGSNEYDEYFKYNGLSSESEQFAWMIKINVNQEKENLSSMNKLIQKLEESGRSSLSTGQARVYEEFSKKGLSMDCFLEYLIQNEEDNN